MTAHQSSRDAIPGFGPRLKLLRKAAGLSQYQLAALAGTSQPSVVDLEAGRRYPSAGLLLRLAGALGVTANDLLPRQRRTAKGSDALRTLPPDSPVSP